MEPKETEDEPPFPPVKPGVTKPLIDDDDDEAEEGEEEEWADPLSEEEEDVDS